MESHLQFRLRRLAKFDLIGAIIGLLYCITLFGIFSYQFAFKDERLPIFLAIFCMLFAFYAMLCVLLVHSAYRFSGTVENTDTDPGMVLERFRTWKRLNCFVLFVWAITLVNGYALVFNICVVYLSRAEERELQILVENMHTKPKQKV